MLTGTSNASRVARACVRLAPHAAAVNLLLNSLEKLERSPTDERLRKVDIEVLNKRCSAPGSTDILHAAGFEYMHGHMVLQSFDAHKLAAAIQGLKQIRDTKDYEESAARAAAEMVAAQRAAAARAAAEAERTAFAAKVPKEPTSDSGATSTCVVNVQSGAGKRVAVRRFDAEHTLRDLLHFVRSLETTPVDGSIKLQNVTQGAVELDCEANLDRSLYSLDLWPVSHVRVVCVGA